MAAYTNQDIAVDVSSTIDLSDGIFLELYLTEPERFGKAATEAKNPVDMWILARDLDGKTLYVSHAPVSFPKKRMFDIMLKRAAKQEERYQRLKEEQKMSPSDELKTVVESLHGEYGAVVNAEQAVTWLQQHGFQETPVIPPPQFADMPRTKFVRSGSGLEISVSETSKAYVPSPRFAVLKTQGNYYAFASLIKD
jgi:hypothetical protein